MILWVMRRNASQYERYLQILVLLFVIVLFREDL
jgi:hypothetical protein